MTKEEKCNCEFEIIENYNEKRDIIGGGCRCHINPPCGFCTTEVRKCIKCGDIETETF